MADQDASTPAGGDFLTFLLSMGPSSGGPVTQAEERDEWSELGLTGYALEVARLWARDLAAAQQPNAPRVLVLAAPTLRMVLDEIRADPTAFQKRAAAVEAQP